MVSVLSKYRALFIVLALLALAALIWLFISGQNSGKVPSKGVFVLGTTENINTAYNVLLSEGGCYDAAGHVKG